jgi:hypothetical protein
MVVLFGDAHGLSQATPGFVLSPLFGVEPTQIEQRGNKRGLQPPLAAHPDRLFKHSACLALAAQQYQVHPLSRLGARPF